MKNKLSFLATTLCLMFFAESVLLQAGEPVNRLNVSPYFNIRQEYRSNIYLEPTNTTSDMITFFTPGIKFLVPGRGGDMSLDYRADILTYWNHSRNNTWRHFLDVKADWQVSGKNDLFIRNRLAVTDDPATSELTELEDRIRNIFEAGLTHKENRVSVGCSFTSIRDKYDNFKDFDRMENYITLNASYDIMAHTDIRARYRYGRIDYDHAARDSYYNELTAGVGGRLSPKITGEILAGYKWRNYEGADDFSGGVLTGRAFYRISPRAKTTASAERGIQESTFGGNNYYDYTRLSLDYEHVMGRKHLLKTGIGYTRNDYPEPVLGAGRKDDIWNFNLGWDYNIRQWITLGTAYDLRVRNSDYPPFDYDYRDDRISVYCKMTF